MAERNHVRLLPNSRNKKGLPNREIQSCSELKSRVVPKGLMVHSLKKSVTAKTSLECKKMHMKDTLKELKTSSKETSAVQVLKPSKPKPTIPKPFHLRTDERGILRERTLLEKQTVSQKEIRPVPSQKNGKSMNKTARNKTECNAKEAVMAARNHNDRQREALSRKDSRSKVTDISIPKTRVVARALVIHSPKKSVNVKTSLEDSKPIKSLCEGTKIPAKDTRKRTGREVKSRVCDRLQTQNLNCQKPKLVLGKGTDKSMGSDFSQEKGIQKETILEKQSVLRKEIRPAPLTYTVSSKQNLIAAQREPATKASDPLKSTKSQFMKESAWIEGFSTRTSTKISATDQYSEVNGNSSHTNSMLTITRERIRAIPKEPEFHTLRISKSSLHKVTCSVRYCDGYKITPVLGDGRCLFRAIAHVAFMRNGGEVPNEYLQRELADDLRARVVEELLKRRQESEWIVEGDFDEHVKQIRHPTSWGGGLETLMASHVLEMMISVYMIAKTSGKLVKIANYGEEYQKEEIKPVELLFHDYGHYEILETFSDQSCQKEETVQNTIYKMEPYQAVSPRIASLQGVYG